MWESPARLLLRMTAPSMANTHIIEMRMTCDGEAFMGTNFKIKDGILSGILDSKQIFSFTRVVAWPSLCVNPRAIVLI